jgi:hypothetical protein
MVSLFLLAILLPIALAPVYKLYIYLLNLYLWLEVPASPPSHPGGCWYRYFSTYVDIDNYVLRLDRTSSWLSRSELLDLIKEVERRPWKNALYTPEFRKQFPTAIWVKKISPGCYHIITPPDPDHPLTDATHARGLSVLNHYYPSELPPGWYGLDTDFFAGSALDNVVKGLHIKDYTNLLRTTQAIATFAVDPKRHKYLTRIGIDLPAPLSASHEHPINYALENRNLQVAAQLLGPKWYALWLNSKKVARMQQFANVPQPTGFFAIRVCGKDYGRYDIGSPDSSRPCSDSPVWFAHDALQHLNERNIGDWFDNHKSLELLVCTLVAPPELLFGCDPMTPEVYRFSVQGDKFFYMPDGQNNGAYFQPLSSVQWLANRKFSSPNQECLHTSVVHSVYAHHVIVFSRRPLLPETKRIVDLPDCALIPTISHPSGTFYQRLTDINLANALYMYANRVNATSVNDLYSKSAGSMAYMYGKYTQEQISAAVLHAMTMRTMSFRATPDKAQWLWLWLTYLFSFNWLSFSWYAQSYATRTTTGLALQPVIWAVPTVATSALPSMPDLVDGHTACQLDDLPDDYIPYHGGYLALMSVWNARLHLWLAYKIVAFPIWQFLLHHVHLLPPLCRSVIYRLDVNVQTWPGAIFTILVMSLSGIRPPRVPTPRLLTPLKHVLWKIYLHTFMLTAAGRRGPTGGSWIYQAALLVMSLSRAAPRLIPWYVSLENKRFETRLDPGSNNTLESPGFFNLTSVPSQIVLTHRNHTHHANGTRPDPVRPPSATIVYNPRHHYLWWLVMAVAFTIAVLEIVRISLMYTKNDLPHHSGHQDPCTNPDPKPPTVPAPTFAAPPPPPPPDPSGDTPPSPFLGPSTTPPGSPPMRPRPAPDFEPEAPAPPGDGIPLQHLNQNGGRVHMMDFDRNPRHYDSLAEFLRHARHLAAPHRPLDPNDSCVWDVIGRALGLEANLVRHIYSASTPLGALDRAHGPPTADRLGAIFSYFRVGMSYYDATAVAGGAAIASDEAPLNNVSPPEPGWPNVVAYLTRNPDGSQHLTDHGTVTQNAPVVMLPRNVAIGVPSRNCTAEEIAAVANIPTANCWARSYSRMHSGLTAASPYTDPTTRNVVHYRNQFVALPRQPLQVNVVDYAFTAADVALAGDLASDLKQYPKAFEYDSNPRGIAIGLDILAKAMRSGYKAGRAPARVRIHSFAGTGGAAKSTALTRYLLGLHAQKPFNNATLRFHTWMHTLRDELKQTFLGTFPFLQSANFCSKAMPLIQPMPGTIVLDDATLLWPGFIQLMCLTNPGITDVILTSDTAQGSMAFPEGDAITRQRQTTSEWLQRFNDNYSVEQFRYSDSMCDLYGLPRPVRNPAYPVPVGDVIICTAIPAGVPWIVISPRFANTMANNNTICRTAGDLQGHEFKGDAGLDLGGLTASTPDATIWTAMTRVKGNLFLRLSPGLLNPSTVDEPPFAASPILSAILAVSARSQCYRITAAADPDRLVARAIQSHLARSIGATAATRLGLAAPSPIVGRYVQPTYRHAWLAMHRTAMGDHYTARSYRAKMELGKTRGAPAFSHHKPTYQHRRSRIAHLLRHYHAVTAETTLEVPATNYTLPQYPAILAQPDPADFILPTGDEALKEYNLPGTPFTTQVAIHDGPLAIQHHFGRDPVLKHISEKKRIKIGKDDPRFTPRDHAIAAKMLSGLDTFFNVSTARAEPFNEALFEQCANAALAPWVSKRTTAAIEKSVEKDEIDRQLTHVKLFLKQQRVKKEPKRYSTATPGQIVSEFPLTKQFRDAIFAGYVEKVVLHHLRPSTYLHCRASPDDLSRWYRKHWEPGPSMANDFTAWDSGCNKTTVLAIAKFFKWIGLPRWYIDTYIHDRLNVVSYLGPHRTKQESGDRWTWLCNTLVNMMISGATVACPVGTPAAFSGDDSIILGDWRRPRDYDPNDWAMTPKLERGSFLEFCGYQFGGEDVTIKSLVVQHRAEYGLACGENSADYWRSIRDAICELGARASPFDVHMANADAILRFAIDHYQLDISLPEVYVPQHI